MTSYDRKSCIDVHVGLRLKLRRMALDITQEQLADHLSVSLQKVQKYEYGVQKMHVEILFQCAQFLSTNIQYFFIGLSEGCKVERHALMLMQAHGKEATHLEYAPLYDALRFSNNDTLQNIAMLRDHRPKYDYQQLDTHTSATVMSHDPLSNHELKTLITLFRKIKSKKIRDTVIELLQSLGP